MSGNANLERLNDEYAGPLFALLLNFTCEGGNPHHLVADILVRQAREPGLPVFLFMLGFTVVLATLLLCLWKNRRNLRRVLYLLGCAAAVGVLFIAAEDWRGSHAWKQFQRQAEARGANFDFASFVSPPVPDDENFALAPVVASSYSEMLDQTGHEIWPRNTNVVNRLEMPYYDYQTSLHIELKDWNLGERTDLIALQQYYRTLAATTNLFPVSWQPQSPAADVVLALSRYDAPLEELRRGAQLPQSRFPLEYKKENPFEILLPHLAALKVCTGMLCLRTSAELQAGQAGLALADLRLVRRLIDSVQAEPFLTTHLARIGMTQVMLQPVWEGLADHRWSDAQITELGACVAGLDFMADYEHSMRAEQAAMAEGMNYYRRHPGQYLQIGDWSAYSSIGPAADLPMALLAECHLIPGGWFYQNQLFFDRILEDSYVPAWDAEARTYSPSLAKRGDAAMKHEREHLSPYNIVGCILFLDLEQLEVAPRFAHGQSSLDLARVAMALESYRLAQGKYPESLSALSPQFIAEVPHDLIGGQPLHYRLTPDGQFVLYSVGWNETDDGGVAVLNQIGPPFQDLSQGDWVWRYPAN